MSNCTCHQESKMTRQRKTEKEFLTELHTHYQERLADGWRQNSRDTDRELYEYWSRTSGKTVLEHAVLVLSPSGYAHIELMLGIVGDDHDKWITTSEFYLHSYHRSVAEALTIFYDRHPNDHDLAEWQIVSDIGWLFHLASKGILEFDAEKGWRFSEYGKSLLPLLSIYV